MPLQSPVPRRILESRPDEAKKSMLILLWSAGFVAALAPAVTDPAQREAAQRCEAGLAEKAGGEISNANLVEFRQLRRHTLLKGTLNALQRPPKRPGELTPTHVISVRFSYECRVDRRGAATVRVRRLQN